MKRNGAFEVEAEVGEMGAVDFAGGFDSCAHPHVSSATVGIARRVFIV